MARKHFVNTVLGEAADLLAAQTAGDGSRIRTGLDGQTAKGRNIHSAGVVHADMMCAQCDALSA